MSENGVAVEGKIFLYEKPELLTKEDHGHLGIVNLDNPYANTKNAAAIPLTLTEFVTAQKYYPIVFSSMENPTPLAVVAALDDRNLFVDDNGAWDTLSYIPAYLRCYPFAFARQGEDQVAVVIDRNAAQVGENADFPFFEGDEASEHSKQMAQFCARYQGARQQTDAFCKKLSELGLFAAQHATYTPEGETEQKVMANYVAIDSEKLQELSTDILAELHKDGNLAAIYAQIASAENWTSLLLRRKLKETQS
ncbi:MAG: SapC family protein [Pseudomonadota bacterium]